MKKQINVYAYFAKNLGDDLMVDIMAKRFPRYNFYTERDIKNPFLLKNKNFKDRCFYKNKYEKIGKLADKLLKKEDGSYVDSRIKKIEDKRFCSVLIGGSIFMQRGALSDAQVRARMRRNDNYLNNGPLFVIGSNFGAYYTDYFKTSFDEHFKKCESVSFRDKASYDMFSHLPNVSYAPDVVFGLEEIPEGKENTNEILVSVIDVQDKYGMAEYAEKYENFIAEFCEYIISQNKTPVLMSFCKKEGDETAIQRILSKIGDASKKTKTYFYDGNIKAALQRIANCDFVLATRFHAAVLALLLNKPFFALAYDIKTENLLTDLNCNRFCNITRLADITPKMIFENTSEIPDVTQIKEMAKNHFAQLEKYLNSYKV